MTRHRRYQAAACVLALAGILIPVQYVAHTLRAGEAVALNDVILGVWILKGALLLVATLMFLLAAFVPTEGEHSLESSRALAFPDRSTVASVLALLLLAGVLRAIHLDAGLWFDEIQTLVEYVRFPIGHIISTLDSQNNHLLYSILSHGSISLLGESAWALRVPAALFGVASIWAVYLFGTQVTTRREAWLAAALLTVSYHHVWFSQNARGYTGLLLWTLLGSFCFIKLLRRDEDRWDRWALLYGTVMALGLYTHLTAVFVLMAHGLIWVLITWRARPAGRRLRTPLLGFIWAGTLTLALYALVVPQVVETFFAGAGSTAQTAWQNPGWMVAETVRGLAHGLPGGAVSLSIGTIITLAGIWSYWRQSPAVAAVMIVPALLTAAAIIALSHNLWPRFFFFSAGFAVLIVFRGVFAVAQAVVPSRAMAVGTLLALLAIAASAFTLPRAYGAKQDFGGARAYVDRARSPNHAAVTLDLTSYVYGRFLRTGYTPVRDLPQLLEIEDRYPKTWVLYTFPVRLSGIYPDIWDHLQTTYDTAAVLPGTVGGGNVVVMVTR